jgi:hypothetical protein
MRRSTRNILLALVGSAGLLTCCLSSCVDVRDEEERDKDGNVVRTAQGQPVTHRHYYFRPWHSWGGSSYGRSYGWYGGSGGSSYTSSGTRPAPAGGGSRPSGTTTSRGGFGSTGHATAGG